MSNETQIQTTAVDAELVQVHGHGDYAFLSRQEKARIACQVAGIVWPETILPEGTALYSSGVDKLRSDRATWQRLPLASEVIGLVQEALRAEERKDFPEDVHNLRLRPSDGRIVRASHIDAAVMGLGYDDHTLRQLVQQVSPLDDAPRGFASALIYLDDQERAEILNKRIALMAKDETPMTLRTKLPHYGDGSRICRAALSKIYGSVTDHDIAEAVGGVLMRHQDVSGRLDYKPGDKRSRFEIIWPSEIPVSTFVVGDVHYVCLSITNSETGEGGIKIVPAVVRARCANLTVSIGEGTEVNIKHVGNRDVLLARVRTAIEMALRDVEPLLQAITESAQIVVTESPVKMFERIARKYALPVGSTVEAWKTTFEKSYDTPQLVSQGSGQLVDSMVNRKTPQRNTVWSLTAAITEAAQSRDGNWTDQAEWERVASDVQFKAVEAKRGGAADPLAKVVMQ